MIGLLCNWFDDWGRSIKDGLGHTGLVIFLVVFACIALVLFWGIIKNALITVKMKIAWGCIILLIIDILFFVWFSTII